MRNGHYLKREVLNLARFISIMKLRPLAWRTAHPYLLTDRFEVGPAWRIAGSSASMYLEMLPSPGSLCIAHPRGSCTRQSQGDSALGASKCKKA